MMKIEIPEQVVVIGYDKGVWITVKDFIFYIDDKKFVIPKHMVLDFYSIPRFLHWWRPNYSGWGGEAALIHDFLRRFYKDFQITIKYTDVVFFNVMKLYNLGTRWVKYAAVRMFTWMTDDGGEGKPCKKIIKAMEKREDSWQDYRIIVLKANGIL